MGAIYERRCGAVMVYQQANRAVEGERSTLLVGELGAYIQAILYGTVVQYSSSRSEMLVLCMYCAVPARLTLSRCLCLILRLLNASILPNTVHCE